ncbi:uncharacterized protein [Parasteatoda tepidariorum]|uniref:uncharacterized protein n=1 Tax=Parasteatoda tepidariorum TaxID=114398 RepID=UPI001C729899|nr:uncharacterized protein LOC107436355 isoform X1 [Parasteatoda tepidariorum]
MGSYAIGNDNDGVHKGKRSGSWTLKNFKTESTERADLIYNFSEPPSLQRIAVVSIAIELCTAPDIRKELTSYILYGIGVINESEEIILDKLFNSSLPSSLKTEISYVIRPILLQLMKTFRSYYRWTGYERNLSEYYMRHGTIYWTVEGAVDIVKSLTELFDNGSLDICHLYKIACSHCLGEYASILWEKTPEQYKNGFRIDWFGEIYDYHFITYWTCFLENNLGSFVTRLSDYENIYDDNLSIDVNMIACAIEVSNVVALQYFWKKLSQQEKNDHLSKWLLQATRCMEVKNYSFHQDSSETLDVLCFLLSHVNRITQMIEFFRNHSRVIVFLITNWPYQRIFLSILYELLDNLPEDIYSCIMQNITSRIIEMENEMMIFKEIWSASPLRLRRSFLKNELQCVKMLKRLLILENLNMAVMILNDASKEEIKLFICFMFGEPAFRRAIYSSNLSSLRILLSKSTLPPECYLYKMKSEMMLDWWLVLLENWHICIDWIYYGNIQAVESFFRWIYQSVGAEIFKKTTSSPYVIYLTLILLSNYERVDQFMNWYFQTEEEIKQFKADFLRTMDNHFFTLFIEMPFIVSERKGDVLQKFINYNLSSLENVAEFRLICRSCAEYALQFSLFESATLLLNVSFDNIDEVKRYKNELILSKEEIKKVLVLNQSLTDADWHHVKLFAMWSSPLSLNTVTELKSLVPEKKTSHTFQDQLNPQIAALLDLLENAVEKDSR